MPLAPTKNAPTISIGRNGRRNRDENAVPKPPRLPGPPPPPGAVMREARRSCLNTLFSADLTISRPRRILS